MGRGIAAALVIAAWLTPLPAFAQPATPDSQIKATVNAIYARYRGQMAAGGPADDKSLYTSRTRDLIARWHKTQPEDEVTPLGDFDWFCQCQDFDDKKFAVTALTVRKTGNAHEASLTYNIGWDDDRSLRLIMLFEDGGWKVDDILFAPDAGITGLRAGLEGEIRDAAKS